MTDPFDDEIRRRMRDAAPDTVDDAGAVLDGLRPRMRRARNRRLAVTGLAASLVLALLVAAAALALGGSGEGTDEVTVAGEPTDGGDDGSSIIDTTVVLEPGPTATPTSDGLVTFELALGVITVRALEGSLDLATVEPMSGWSVVRTADGPTSVEVDLSDGSELFRWRAALRAGTVLTSSGRVTIEPAAGTDADPVGSDPTAGPPGPDDDAGSTTPPDDTPTADPAASPTISPSPGPTQTPSTTPTATPRPSPTPDDDASEPDEDEEEHEDGDGDGDETPEPEETETPEPEETETPEPEETETPEPEERSHSEDGS